MVFIYKWYFIYTTVQQIVLRHVNAFNSLVFSFYVGLKFRLELEHLQ